jgi:hypothetical protein
MIIARCLFAVDSRLLHATLLACLLFGLSSLLSLSPAHAAPLAEIDATHTIVTIDTLEDLDSDSTTRTCGFTGGTFVAAADGKCTFRRALVEAIARPQADRPITITFNLPPSAVSSLGTWTIPIEDTLPPLDPDNGTNGGVLVTNSNVHIDGNTQTGGRTDGPKIILQTNEFSLLVQSDNNDIRNLAFQGGGTIALDGDNNVVTGVWMGLSEDGQEVVFRTGQPMRMAGGGITMRGDNNLVEENVLTGTFANAVFIDGGDNNTVQNNLIGTRADGTVPDVPALSLCARSLDLDLDSWYGGWGISLTGSDNKILNNRIAGLHIVQTANSTPPMAIESFGARHEISGNIIGVDSDGKEVGVCGQGIKISSTDTQVLDNEIIGSRPGFEDDAMTAIMGSGGVSTFNSVTVRRNIVKDGPGNVYAFGPAVNQSLSTFAPAKITGINGTSVAGTSGDGSPCPGCIIDFYLDDVDNIGEALEYLGTTTADAEGNFTFTLPQVLASGTGIRTNSTSQSSGVIPNYGAGTTTRTSKLYMALSSIEITGPMSGTVGESYAYTFTVRPEDVPTPLDYIVSATDKTDSTLNDTTTTVTTITYQWNTPGVKTIAVTVKDELNTITETLEVTIAPPPQTDSLMYMPKLEK